MKNILLITIDCLRYDRCGFNGHHLCTTPTLDALAGESHVFDAAFATGPYTPESIPGILAGLHGFNSAYYEDVLFKAIPNDAPTIASELETHGYDTIGVVTNPQLTQNRNYSKGFNTFENIRVGEGPSLAEDRAGATVGESAGPFEKLHQKAINLARRPARRLLKESDFTGSLLRPLAIFHRYAQLSHWPSVRGTELRQQLLSRLPNQKEESPFFAWTHFNDLHAPIHPDTVNESPMDIRIPRHQQFRWDAHRVANIQQPGYDMMYDSAVAYVDEQIRRIIDVLKERELWEETILIVTSDHGEALYDHGVYGHTRHYPYDELLHVPLLVHIPDGTATRHDQVFSLAWLHRLLGSVLDVDMRGFPSQNNINIFEKGGEENIAIADSISFDGHTIIVRDNKQKLVRHFEGESSRTFDEEWADALEGGVFAINTDKSERHRLPAEVASEVLHSHVESVQSDANDLDRVAGALSDEVEEQLQRLGYKT